LSRLLICAVVLISVTTLAARPLQGAVVTLGGVNHVGYLSISGINTEEVQPNSGLPGSKNLQYPHYFNPNLGTTGLWDFVVAERLSSTSVYAEESNFAVIGKNITDANFSSTNLGQINFGQPLTGVGQEMVVLTPSDFALNFSELSPLTYNAFRNSNNEFSWDYVAESIAIGSPVSLTYQNGVLTSIDGSLNLGLSVRLLGNDALKFRLGDSNGPIATFDGTLSFSSDRFAFAIDESQDVFSAFGTLEDVRMVFNRRGTLDGVTAVPEPTSALLVVTSAVALLRRRRRKFV
jgi:hypothetical protein